MIKNNDNNIIINNYKNKNDQYLNNLYNYLEHKFYNFIKWYHCINMIKNWKEYYIEEIIINNNNFINNNMD